MIDLSFIKTIWFKIFAVSLGLIVIGLSGLTVLGMNYSERVLPSVFIGDIPIGGTTEEDVAITIGNLFKKISSDGVTVSFQDGETKKTKKISIPVTIDPLIEARQVMKYNYETNPIIRGWEVVARWVGQKNITLATLSISSSAITDSIKASLSVYERPAVSAKITITSVNPIQYTITSSTPGIVFNYDGIGNQVLASWRQLQSAQVTLPFQVEEPRLREADVEMIAPRVKDVFVAGPITLAYFDSHTKLAHKWTITKQRLAEWLNVAKDEANQPVFVLAEDAIIDYISNDILPTVQVAPSDAVFVLNASSTRVTKFVGGRPGVTVDIKKTRENVQSLITQRLNGVMATSTPLIIAKVEPLVRTEDTNTLGIKEILGIGYSNFSGSPRNRILNIRNAVTNKLYGTLVPPDTEFSLVQALKPFTLESGYLPELVIKGDRITPEIAGGLCQVGTTMFRTAMNSGMPITARTNHGLVVSYYNDPANGNPGTDATIYDAWPDFRFKNDTGHHVLIVTDMNTKNGALTFTMWGTNDGRKGYYTPPKVLSRTPTGPAKIIETKDLPPGKKECQSTHPGAVAAFDYIRELASGKKEVREFRSVYRAVPATCYVGYDPNKSTCKEGDEQCIATSAPVPVTEPSPITNPVNLTENSSLPVDQLVVPTSDAPTSPPVPISE